MTITGGDAAERESTGDHRLRSPAFRRALISALWLVVIGLAIHVLLPQISTLERSVDVLRSLAWWAVMLAIIAQVFSYAGNGLITRALVRIFGRGLGLLRCVGIVMGSYSLSLLWGGQVTQTGATFRWLRAAGVPAEGALLVGVIPGLINVFTIVAVSMFGLAYLLTVHRLSLALAAAFAVGLALLLLVCSITIWGVRHRPWFRARLHGLSRAVARVLRRPYDPAATDATARRLFDAWDLLVRGAWRGPIIGDALNVGFDILTLYLLFVAAHYTPSPGLVLAGYGLPLLAGKLALLPGGLGVVEGGMVGLYEALGVPGAVVVVVILVYRLVSFWIPALIGFPLVPLLNRTQPPRDAAQRELGSPRPE